MDSSNPSSLSLILFRPLQPSAHNNAGAVVVLPKHSVARLSLGPGRLANHLLTKGGRHLIKFIGHVGDKLGYGPAHPARQIVDAQSDCAVSGCHFQVMDVEWR